jgi:hypothetical protein
LAWQSGKASTAIRQAKNVGWCNGSLDEAPGGSLLDATSAELSPKNIPTRCAMAANQSGQCLYTDHPYSI